VSVGKSGRQVFKLAHYLILASEDIYLCFDVTAVRMVPYSFLAAEIAASDATIDCPQNGARKKYRQARMLRVFRVGFKREALTRWFRFLLKHCGGALLEFVGR
jgi:hypothetical protein